MEKEILNITHRIAQKTIIEGKWTDEPSLTVQGLSEPMSTIIERFQRGQTIMGSKIYYDSEVNENFETEQPFKESEYDLSDLDKARQDHQRVIEELKSEKAKRIKAQKLIDDEKLADEVLARRQKSQKTEPTE